MLAGMLDRLGGGDEEEEFCGEERSLTFSLLLVDCFASEVSTAFSTSSSLILPVFLSDMFCNEDVIS